MVLQQNLGLSRQSPAHRRLDGLALSEPCPDRRPPSTDQHQSTPASWRLPICAAAFDSKSYYLPQSSVEILHFYHRRDWRNTKLFGSSNPRRRLNIISVWSFPTAGAVPAIVHLRCPTHHGAYILPKAPASVAHHGERFPQLHYFQPGPQLSCCR